MQYYNEEKMQDIRLRLEEEILSWPNVTTRKMYGCPCYKHNNKLFAFMMTDGVVLVRVSEDDKAKLSKEFQIRPFQAGEKRIMKNWPQVRVGTTTDLEKIIPYIKRSYNLSKRD